MKPSTPDSKLASAAGPPSLKLRAGRGKWNGEGMRRVWRWEEGKRDVRAYEIFSSGARAM